MPEYVVQPGSKSGLELISKSESDTIVLNKISSPSAMLEHPRAVHLCRRCTMIGSLSQMPSRRKVYFRPSRRKISPAISAIPSKQLVNAVGGAKPARNVCIGDKLWTLHNGEVKETTVTHIDFQKVHEVVEVVTSRGILKVTTNQPLATPQGWVEAKAIVGRQIEWTHARSLCRERYTP